MFHCSVLRIQCLPFHFVFLLHFLCYCAIIILLWRINNYLLTYTMLCCVLLDLPDDISSQSSRAALTRTRVPTWTMTLSTSAFSSTTRFTGKPTVSATRRRSTTRRSAPIRTRTAMAPSASRSTKRWGRRREEARPGDRAGGRTTSGCRSVS